jgi:membrane associated rhomboid family serine protease
MDADKTTEQPLPSVSQRTKTRFPSKEMWKAMRWPLAFVILLWSIELVFELLDIRFIDLGNQPRSLDGITGIFTSPLIHANADHLLSNTLPLIVVGSAIFHFYNEISLRVIALIWFLTGFWVWLIGRPEFHIGASGLIYGSVVFLFFSGVFRKDVRLMAISMLVVFLYGSLAWGILPIDPTQSWESHLSGSVAGLFVAIYYRKEKPFRIKYQWEIDEEMEALNSLSEQPTSTPIEIIYHLVEDKREEQENNGN